MAADDDVDAGNFVGEPHEVGHRPQVGQADDDLAAGIPEEVRLRAGDGVDGARKPADDLGGVVLGVFVSDAEDADFDPVDRPDDGFLDHARERQAIKIDIGVEERQGYGIAAGQLAADDSRQGIEAQVKFMVAQGHRVVEVLHDLEFRITQILVELEAADEDVAGVEGENIVLSRRGSS